MTNLIDLRSDLEDLVVEAANLREEVKLYQSDAQEDNKIRELLSKSGLASNTTKLYTGCEKIMEHLTKIVDKAPIIHSGGGWHALLLVRMSEPFHDIRQGIISENLFTRLNLLRGFRHRERSSYGRQLDGTIVAERAIQMADAANLFKEEVEAFMQDYSERKEAGNLPN